MHAFLQVIQIRDVLTNLDDSLSRGPYYDDRFALYAQAVEDIYMIAFREDPHV